MPRDGNGFLARIREAPDDDGPRLVYADWLDDQADPRGEFIRLQLALATIPPYDRRRPGLERAADALLGRHAVEWAAPFRGLANGPVFRRGFVDEVKVTARQFLAHADALFAAGPVRHLHLLDVGGHLDRILFSPHLTRLTGLTVFAQHLGDGLARAIAESPHLAGLKVLRIGRNRVGDAGAAWVAGSPHLAGLEELDLSENELAEAGGLALSEPRFAGLRRLELGGNAVGPAAAGAVAASPTLPALDRLGLEGNRVGGPRLESVPRPAALFRVGSLDLSANALTAAGLGLLLGDQATAVRDLDLAFNAHLGDDGVARLAGSPAVAGLHTLRLTGTGVTDDGLAALANSPHLRRLTALDVSNNPVGDVGLQTLVDAQGFRLKRLTYPGIGISTRMRATLEMRFNRDAVAVW